MSALFGCPPQGALTDIPSVCNPTIGQIVRIGFVKYKDDTLNAKTKIAVSEIQDEAAFQLYLDVPDDLRISMTPYIGEPTFEVGAL